MEKVLESITTSATSTARVITLTEPEVLDCPICCQPLTIPIFQCDKNGHIVCSSCRGNIKDKCPSCACTFSSSRNLAMEKPRSYLVFVQNNLNLTN
ncbi:putative aminoacyltransferase, E1 ubiquitin-activating enzyme [Rosa chinensis]|uniref:Putative aminoacyltransferase, E1 ubiquitin-activating enzyme n=1 Tax=Rosa chinensis TaxID=74649 RepID=A0A2P6R5A1_ROSCH|nr:putative aminoacyltransferase, E1 ubiquitin-activating enzyme [Rosa chinensis]